MFALGFPSPILSNKIHQCGNPYHGWVQGGTLHLPNSATRAQPQPAYSEDDTAGQTFRFKMPGIPAVVRTPEELAADAAAGIEWRDEGVISGSHHQIYLHDLNGWLWWDSAGRRWLVTCPEIMEGTVVFGAAATLHVTLTRFGYNAGGPEVHTYTVTLSDLGQSGGTVNAQDGGTSPAPITTGKIRIDDIKPDGSAALLMMHVYRGTNTFGGATDKDPMIRWPLGWLELTLSGLGESATIGLTVARSRVQTLAVTRDAVPALEFWWAGIRWNGSDYEFFISATDDDISTDSPVIVGEGEWAYHATRLLALRYGSGGAIEEVALKIDWAGVLAFPQVSQAAWRQERDWSCSAAFSVTLLNAGATVDSVAGTYTSSGTQFIEWGFTVTPHVNGSAFVSSYGGDSYDETVEFEGDTKTATRTVAEIFDLHWPYGLLSVSDTSTAKPRGLCRGDRNWPQAYDLSQASAANLLDLCCSCPAWRVIMPNGDTYSGEIARQSTQVLGMRIHHQLSTDPTYAGGGSWGYRPAATPSGSYGASTTRAFVAGGERLFASHDAYSGQVRWLNATPVCWV